MKYAFVCVILCASAISSAAAELSLDRAVAVFDRETAAELRAKGIALNGRVDDETFIRRIYLDVAGRIPSHEEVRAFLDAADADKRKKMIHQLVASDAWVSRQYNFWADVLRVKTRLSGTTGPAGKPYETWIKDQLRKNTPYDEFVHELITAEGAMWNPEEGAVGYYLRDRGMPLDNLSNTMQIFTGTQLQCAQCHDHPSDKWTQRQFYEMAAFTDMGRFAAGKPAPGNVLGDFKREYVKKNGKKRPEGADRTIGKSLRDILAFDVVGTGTGQIKLPKDYAYRDGKPGDVVKAKTIFGNEAVVPVAMTKGKKHKALSLGNGSREVFADWLVSKENPRFTKVIANRMFKQAFGWGLIEPVDDLRDDTLPVLPRTQHVLEKLMVACDYDLRAFMKVIYNSRLYQSEATNVDPDTAMGQAHAGPVLRRMTAEQMWDSLLTLAFPDVDQRKYVRHDLAAQNMHEAHKKLSGMTGKQILSATESASKLDGRDQRNVRKAMSEALGINGESQMKSMMKAEAVKRFDTPERRELARKMAAAKKKKNHKLFGKLRDEMRALNAGGKYNKMDMVRASELDSPAPNGHFLRRFGASDREQIENADNSPAVTQTLTLLNGWVDEMLLPNPNSAIRRVVDREQTVRGKSQAVYEAILARRPHEHEFARAAVLADEAGEDFAADLIWALVNTNEFMFVR